MASLVLTEQRCIAVINKVGVWMKDLTHKRLDLHGFPFYTGFVAMEREEENLSDCGGKKRQ